MSFATLCHRSIPSPDTVNGALQELQGSEIGYLISVCQKHDAMHRMLKSVSINALDYLMVSNFPVHPKDRVGIDVRCL